jgi:UDP-GlcNAc:undecaprenyl-phosphate/decaprenyl-phosphate GlcNAc-1-phosphate transferase
MPLIYLGCFGLSLIVSLFLTRSVRDFARRKGWVSRPSPHHIPGRSVPRLGGVAIFASVVLVVGIIALAHRELGLSVDLPWRTLDYVLASGTIIFLLGLWDDFRPLSAPVKLAIQSLAACVLYFGGFRVVHVPILFGSHMVPWLSLPLTILWVLLITNAFNLIDGLDGLAAGSALFSIVTVSVLWLSGGNNLMSLLSITMAGATLGFLRFNFSPASIFLGDSGSLFLGFTLSALALTGSQKTPTVVAVAIPVVSFGLPLMETVLTVFRRFLRGQPMFIADREHIHHKLLQLGYSQRSAVFILYGVSAVFGLLSLMLLNPGGPTVGIVLLIIGLGVWLGIQQLGYREFFELRRAAFRTFDQKKVISSNLAIHRAIERLDKPVEDYDHLCEILQAAFQPANFLGFRLDLSPMLNRWPAGRAHNRIDGAEKNDCGFVWNPAEGEVADRNPRIASWSIVLDLKAEPHDEDNLGSFSLYGSRSTEIRVLDIELLTSGFSRALSKAVLALNKAASPVASGGMAAQALVLAGHHG